MKCRTAAVALGLLLAACSGSDSDKLELARHHLRPAPCDGVPAVSALATVNDDPHQAFLQDWVLVSVCNLRKLADDAAAAQAPITLFIEGIDTGNEPSGIDLESGTLTFVLERNPKNRDLWKPYLYDPLFDPDVSVHVSVGIRGDHPLPRVPNGNLTLRITKLYVDWTTWLWLALLVVCGVVLIACARYTGMLRDAAPIAGGRGRYSLSRSQMAWWFFLIIISYVFIWLVTGDRDTIPPSLLGLMGISAATALAANAIRRSDVVSDHATRGWWRDLVVDERGVVALDRLQIVVWTFVLSGIFLTSVIWDLTMPEFNATLLALMGISSGAYLGFQLPHKPADEK